MRILRGAAGAFALAAIVSTSAQAQTGVSDDRVSLPDGPGSLEGLGDDARIDPNMGQMSYLVPIELPAGFPGATPGLSLSYSSGAGNGVAGMGWSIGVASIERMTVRGVPKYDLDDIIVGETGELVYVEGTNPRIYRARFEGAFIRYSWHDADAGADGYWTAEYPDGRVATFGATAAGDDVATARLGGDEGTFRWQLVTMRDVWGHTVDYSYSALGGTNLLVGATWGDDAEGDPQYAVALTYETRADSILTANGGFEETLAHRLQKIEVKARGTTIRTYALAYDSQAEANGFTRLASVTLKGLDGSTYPGVQTFQYSRSLGATCSGEDCGGPYVVELTAGGSLGVNFRNRNATLIDINGDGLPDIVDSSIAGQAHRIFLNQIAEDGTQSFAAPFDSALGLSNEHELSVAYVQPLDANGDGFTDLMHATSGKILFNKGLGDWAEKTSVWATNEGGLPDLEGDFEAGDNELRTLRFIDYDNDKKIDMLRSTGTGQNNNTVVYRNVGGGFTALDAEDGIEKIEVGFEDDGLDLNDINGDGLTDIVHVTTATVRYRLNHGYGRWADWRQLAAVSLTTGEAEDAELEDMNGDGLSDLVLVKADRIQIWLNKNGEQFVAQADIMDADVEGSLPVKGSTDTVLYADMNGNGTTDIVWLTTSGDISFVELYPVKPNLLSRIDNGLGLIQDVTYATSVSHMARDGGSSAWAYRIPFGNIVVDAIDIYDLTTGVHQVRSYDYHDGYFDGVEKAFRGYESVEETFGGDQSQEPGEARYTYDIGATDRYMAGRMLTSEALSNGRSLQLQTREYADCDVVGVTAELEPYDIRFICPTFTTVQLREGAAEAEWATVRTEQRWDDQGNVVTNIHHGVVGMGADGTGACGTCERDDDEYGAPCGAQCLGDEKYIQRDFVDVDGAGNIGGRWLLNAEWRQRSGADEDVVAGAGTFDETVTYYDGDAFIGRAAGEIEEGGVTRVAAKVDGSNSVDLKRAELDQHGNAVTELDALATIGGEGHRVHYTYSDDGLRLTRMEVPMAASEGGYTLVRALRYESIWDKISVSTDWQAFDGDTALTPAASTAYGYDAFGRVASVTLPGDAAATPSIAYAYTPGTPSRTTTSLRSVIGGAQDVTHVRCTDGRGRTYQERFQTSPGNYLVSGFATATPTGADREIYQPWMSTSSSCDTAAPANTSKTTTVYDALSRPIAIHLAPVAGEAADPMNTLVYGPLETKTYDLGDNTASYAHADTPTVKRVDGMGRVTAIGRTLTQGAEPEWFTIHYDALGRVARIVDPMGNERVQRWDLLGRIVEVDDLDRGNIAWTYDDVGHELTKTDGGGTTVNSYDSAGRLVAKWVDGAEAETKVSYQWDLPGECPDDVCDMTANLAIGVSYASAMGEVHEWSGLDPRRRATKIRRVVSGQGGDRSFDITTTFDNLNRVTKTEWPGGIELAYTLDAHDRVTAIPGFVDSLTLSARGQVTRAVFANGVEVTQAFDERARPTTIDITGVDDTLLVGLSYTRDAAGLIASVQDRGAPTGLQSAAATFEYDAFARLTSATLDPGSSFEETIAYLYDAADNMVERTSTLGDASAEHDGTRVLAADKAHQVIQIGDKAIAYDDTGRVIARGTTTFDWDGYGRLSEAREDGQVVSQHAYGKDAERIWSKSGDETSWFLSDAFMIVDGVASLYVKLGDQSVARHEVAAGTLVLDDVNTDDAVNVADAWLVLAGELGFITAVPGSDIDETLAASAAQNLIGFGERKTFLHRDHIDNVVAVTDESGALVERSTRYPFGGLRSTTTNDRELMGFTDKLEDEATGLVHIGVRQYDPAMSRWIAPDLLFEAIDTRKLDKPWEAMGAYIYADNNPVMGQDQAGGMTWNGPEFQIVAQAVHVYIAYYAPKSAYGTITQKAQQQALGQLGKINGQSSNSLGDAIQFVHLHRQEIADELEQRSMYATPKELEAYDAMISSFEQANRAYDQADNEESEDGDDEGMVDLSPMAPISLASQKKQLQNFQGNGGDFSDNLNSLALGNDLMMDDVLDEIGQNEAPNNQGGPQQNNNDFSGDDNSSPSQQSMVKQGGKQKVQKGSVVKRSSQSKQGGGGRNRSGAMSQKKN